MKDKELEATKEVLKLLSKNLKGVDKIVITFKPNKKENK